MNVTSADDEKNVRSVLKFFLFTFIVSWTFYAVAIRISGGVASPGAELPLLSHAIFLLGVFAPSLVAIGLTAQADGRAGIVALLHQIVQFPESVRWYVFAVSYVAVIKLIAALLHRLIAGVWPQFGDTPFYIMMGAVLLSTPVQAGEEIGWRGYALPRLASRVGLTYASLIIGVIWALWHLPLFFIPVGDVFGQSFPVYLLQVTAISVTMGWLYWRTNGSLFLTMLLHAAVNNTKDIVPSTVAGAMNPFALSTSRVAWLTVFLLWICAVYFLIRMRGASLQSVPKVETECTS